jgi:hypothetical protein
MPAGDAAIGTGAAVRAPAVHGSVTVNVLPRPAVLSTATSPPCSIAIRFVSTRPRPVPLCLRARLLSS